MSRDLQSDIANVFSRMELNRRHMMASSLAAAGFALAVQPIGAATITTTDSRSYAIRRDVRLPPNGNADTAFYCAPACAYACSSRWRGKAAASGVCR